MSSYPKLPALACVRPATAANIISFGLGMALHKLYFGHYKEFDLEAPRICLFYVVLFVLTAWCALVVERDATQSLVEVMILSSLHALGMFLSIFIYRATPLGNHRLAGFQGPWWAKVTHLYIVGLTVRHYHLYEELLQLHATYGDYVRIGPNTLSIADPAAVKAIHGPQSQCTKGPMYDIAHPRHTLHFSRDKWQHAQRRRNWRRAFNSQAMASYEPLLRYHATQLMDLISRNTNKPINIAKYFNLFSFDTMGSLGFAQSFGRMEAGRMDYYMENLHKNTLMAGTFSHMPWVVQIIKHIPLFNWQYTSFISHSKSLAEERIREPSEKTTIFGPILQAYEAKRQKTGDDSHDLYGDADLIVVAGSDTIAAALTSASFCLTQHPQHITKVRELLEISPLEATLHIDAIIHEALRLYPVIASGLQRITPSQGLQIGADMWIPGNVRVQTPSYVMFRDSRSFVRADEFIPERFTDQKANLTNDLSVYIPFNTGVYSCIGRHLAMRELNIVFTELIKRFDFQFAPGQTEDEFSRSTRDTFTLYIKDLRLSFTPVSVHL